jgi:hypothetical protein
MYVAREISLYDHPGYYGIITVIILFKNVSFLKELYLRIND